MKLLPGIDAEINKNQFRYLVLNTAHTGKQINFISWKITSNYY